MGCFHFLLLTLVLALPSTHTQSTANNNNNNALSGTCGLVEGLQCSCDYLSEYFYPLCDSYSQHFIDHGYNDSAGVEVAYSMDCLLMKYTCEIFGAQYQDILAHGVLAHFGSLVFWEEQFDFHRICGNTFSYHTRFTTANLTLADNVPVSTPQGVSLQNNVSACLKTDLGFCNVRLLPVIQFVSTSAFVVHLTKWVQTGVGLVEYDLNNTVVAKSSLSCLGGNGVSYVTTTMAYVAQGGEDTKLWLVILVSVVCGVLLSCCVTCISLHIHRRRQLYRVTEMNVVTTQGGPRSHSPGSGSMSLEQQSSQVTRIHVVSPTEYTGAPGQVVQGIPAVTSEGVGYFGAYHPQYVPESCPTGIPLAPPPASSHFQSSSSSSFAAPVPDGATTVLEVVAPVTQGASSSNAGLPPATTSRT